MYKLLIIAALALLLVGTGCKKQTVPQGEQTKIEKIDTNSVLQTSPLSEEDSKNVSLVYRPEVGKTYIYNLVSVIEENSKIVADSSFYPHSKQTVAYNVNVKANDIEEDGTIDAQFTVSAIKLLVSMGKEKIEYTSGEKMDSAKRMKFLDYEGLLNSSFGARISKTGEILEVYKTDKLINRFLSLRGISRDTIPAQEIAEFTQNIIAAGLRPLVKQIFRELSKEQISKNSAWEVAQPAMNMQVVGFESKSINTFAGVEKFASDKVAKINVGLQSRSITNPEASKSGINVKKSSLSGTGDLYFNMSKGMFQQNKTTLVVNIGIEGIAPTKNGPKKYSSDRSTSSSYYLNLVEVK